MKLRHLTALLVLFLLPTSSWALSLDEETKYGTEMYVQVTRAVKLYADPYTCIEMDLIRQRLESVADLPLPIKLSVMDTSTLDAFAMVGGFVFITTGILEQADNEEEIAGVLAHEFSHVGRRHVAKAIEKEKPINWGTMAALVLGMLLPSPAAKAVVMMGGVGAGQAVSLKYSRDAEEEADRFGVATAERAGYNGLGTAEFLKKLASTGLEKMVPQYLLTHPYSEDRVAKIQQIASPMRTRVDVSLFPFIVARIRILGKPLGAQNEEIWLKKYQRDPYDPVSVYGAALVYSLKGETDRALALAKTINSPHMPLFAGEFLVTGRRFKEAIEVLRKENHPVARFYLAKAYEGQGDLVAAESILRELIPYAGTFPEVYQKMGMVIGRQGDEAGGYEYLGRYYLETGRFPAAKVNLEKALLKYGMNSDKAPEIMRLLDTVSPDQKKQRGGKS